MRFFRSSMLVGILAALLISVGIVVAAPVFAQDVDLKTFAEQAGFSTTADVTTIIARLIRTAISFIGVIAISFVIYGGFMFMTAGGNAERIKSARRILINALLGVLIVLASFVIVSFILDALTDATSSSIISVPSDPLFYPNPGTSSQFYLRDWNEDCTKSLQNVELQFIFSKTIDENDTAMVKSGIKILEEGETVSVDGTFEISGSTVFFTPSTPCAPPYDAYFCFDATTNYTVDLDATVLESANGSSLTCSTGHECSLSFTTGTGVDIKGPTVTMNAPADGESLYEGFFEQLQAATTDDTGVSSVNFYLIDDDQALYTSGIDLSTYEVLTGGDIENAFSTDVSEEWDTNGYSTNETYDIWAEGSDCSGNSDTADRVKIILRAGNCNNAVQDISLGETDVDCGGSTTSAYYCGQCSGSGCTENSDCSSGQCVTGFCVETPKIESVSAGDGAIGNLITISGEAFGADEGTVTFLGTENGDEITASAYSCNNQVQWSDTEIIVQIPFGAVDGPISVTTTDTTQNLDRTDDDYGPSIADFDVNLIKRPGICQLSPNSGESATAVVVNGNGFGFSQGTSTFYFTNYEASSYASWDAVNGESFTVGVPNVNAGNYRTQVFTGDYVCIDSLGDPTGVTCSEDSDCYAVAGTDAGESCATAWCSETLDYCVDDDACGATGGDCESIRVGSNQVSFEVKETSSDTTPIIASIDTGWSACTGGADFGDHCGDGSECESGVCDSQPTWGPPGQYLTIYGTNFGTAEGSVFLENNNTGDTALADTIFPEACGKDFWHDTYITVKIPGEYQNAERIKNSQHSLFIERQDGKQSDSTTLLVRNDAPGPSLCDIEPSAGPVGTEVTLYGENFGSSPLDGIVKFYSEVSVSTSLVWGNDEISNIEVPQSATTGPVYVIEAEKNYSSNSINFEVGNCNDDLNFCQEGESCCSDGSCASASTVCPTSTPVESHYAFKVSTGIIPNTPNVVVQCDSKIASPAPWEGWSRPDTICVNTLIEADFDMTMNEGSLNATNIVVEKCTAFYTEDEQTAGDGIEGECKTWEAVTADTITTSTTGFSWKPLSGSFEANTSYRVTLNGYGKGDTTAIQAEATAIQAAAGTPGGYLENDYVWEFTTSSSTDLCKVGGVNVSPLTEMVDAKGNLNYLANLVSAKDQCVPVSCTGQALKWTSDFLGATVPELPGVSVCSNIVAAISETAANDPAVITALVTTAEGNPSGDGKLTINFTDPGVDAYFPDCSEACVNALPWAEFNTDMNANTITPSSVVMYQCEDSLCVQGELTSVTIINSIDYDASMQRLEIKFKTDSNMTADTWYRIILDGDAILAANGNQLSDFGSNYGSDANRYFVDDFSWVFKTKDSDVTCKVDSVVVSPDVTTATYVGDRAQFDATAYGEPDTCSVNGQALQSSLYAWSAWSATDTLSPAVGDTSGSSSDQADIVAYMIKEGKIELTNDLPAYCSASCLNIGASVTTSDGVCGNGTLETYEECDDGATVAGDGCSAECLDEGTSACTTTMTSGCCGDGTRDYSWRVGGEDCDDGDLDSGDGCSSVCLNEGSKSVGATCGDATQDWYVGTGGEDCDDDNTVSGDGCSSNCLKEGSQEVEDVYAICGNGGSPENGEDCDDGNVTEGDGCSSACLNEGETTACTDTITTSCCGNNDVETGEDCDDGNADAGDGCSDVCLDEGSSYSYTTPSFCGDGDTGTGEECDADASDTTIVFSVGDYSVGQIADGAPQEVNASTGYAVSSVSATVDGKTDSATFQLECSCTTDASCGDVATLGCGASNCCYTRPELTEAYPPNNTASPGDGYCRNSAIYADFTDLMEDASFDGNLYLDLVSIDGEKVSDATECPTGNTTTSVLSRAWQWLRNVVFGIFGIEAQASDTFDCFLPVSYDTITSLSNTDRVYLRYSSLLEAGGIYHLIFLSDNTSTNTTSDGVLSENQVSLCLGSNCSSAESFRSFYVGDEICELDSLLVEDQGIVNSEEYEDASEEFFSSTGEEHSFTVTPLTLRDSGSYEEISELTGINEWSYTWSSSVGDTDKDDVVGLKSGGGDSTTANYTASGTEGEESVIVTAEITLNVNDPDTEGDTTTETLEVTAIVCENPWPALGSELGFPYVEDETPSNFSFYYCRDAGEAGTDDDLPALDDPINVTSSSSSLIEELIFKVSDSSDAIGVRVSSNFYYASPSAWVEAQEFTGSFSETTLDGYPAVESGTTVYTAAANQDGGTIYPNIYVVSYNDDADEDAVDIFTQILENWEFNANDDVVTDINLCSDGTDFVLTSLKDYLSCDWDGDCLETCENGKCSLTGEVCTDDTGCALVADVGICDGEKAKLTRDMQRLTDVTDMVATLQAFGEANAHCAVTTDISCEVYEDCPGKEECLLGFPDIQTGTFVPALTNSAWGSWNSAFANELGTTPPTDPVNEFYNCVTEGYDVESCWNGEAGTFICPGNSHVYGYQSSGGIAYTLYTQMEVSGDLAWAYDLDTETTDEVTIVAEYPLLDDAPETVEAGFVQTPKFCDGGTLGDSELCGDGTQGVTEFCEIGDTQTILCKDSNEEDGLISLACLSDCSDYQKSTDAVEAGAECEPYSCGNGVVEGKEICDDGSLNGSYGYCDDLCTYDDAFLCGDGYLAGTEACDCGETGLYNYSAGQADDEYSWAFISSCDVSNGQYTDDINVSCAYDCSQPGLSCGDEVVNGAEQCDGDYEEWEGALCFDGTECTTDSDCFGGTCGAGGSACGTGDVCTDYEDAGEECVQGSECDSGTCTDGKCTSTSNAVFGLDAGEVCTSSSSCESGSCPDFNYSLYHYRNCRSDCSWPVSWSPCVGGEQICGNGSVEGAEECDDGNSSNNDDCLNTCVENVCGDDHVETGVESCDGGDDNGDLCEADYEGTCNYCNAQCQYKSRSGGYCGDEEINGDEVCDGSYSTQLNWFDAETQDTQSVCDTDEYDKQKTVETTDDYTCRWLGVCNGGSENGNYCTLDYSTYASSGTVQELGNGNQVHPNPDVNACLDGVCVPPVCAENCGSSCPISFEITGLLVQSELLSSGLTDAISLYSFGNVDGFSPDAATLYIPACTVGTNITATIGNKDITMPDVDIVFVTDLTSSMDTAVDGGSVNIDEKRKIDYAVDATLDTIEELFDAFSGKATLQVGLVSYTTDYREKDFCNHNEAQTDGAWKDSELVGEDSESSLLTFVESYKTCVSNDFGSTPMYNALKEAKEILGSTQGDVKIMVILTDGDYDWNDTFVENKGDEDHSEECIVLGDTGNDGKVSTTTYHKTLNDEFIFEGKPACAADMYDDFIEGSSYYFYTAAITSDSTYQAYTEHISSNDCAWSSSDAASDLEDCTGNYAFAATSSEEIDLMYEAIVDSIFGTVVTFTTTDASGTTTTSGEVQAGENVTLPFPDGFVCDSTEQLIPMRNEFFGSGAMSFSDFEFTYCPY